MKLPCCLGTDGWEISELLFWFCKAAIERFFAALKNELAHQNLRPHFSRPSTLQNAALVSVPVICQRLALIFKNT
jgi:hypothetical protein